MNPRGTTGVGATGRSRAESPVVGFVRRASHGSPLHCSEETGLSRMHRAAKPGSVAATGRSPSGPMIG